MNTVLLPTRPATPTKIYHPTPEPSVRLGRLFIGLLLAIAAFDVCFWGIDDKPGLALGVYFAALGAALLLNRERKGFTRSARLLVTLLVGAVWAAAVDTSITNSIALLTLVTLLAGDTFYHDIGAPWGRWLSQFVALILAPGRVFWLAARTMEAIFGGGLGRVGRLLSAGLLATPALALALVFGALLATGNAVFASWTNDFFDWLWKTLVAYFDFGRILLWMVAALIALPLLRPARVAESWWKWMENLPTAPELIPARGAFYSCALVLAVLNTMFLIANFADVMFLWSGATLPAGVTYKGYVHEGVNALIATVILSALVLAAIFQQAPAVARRRELKLLSYFWIAQNFVLMASVAERLWRYIDVYGMTVARQGVLIFLLLVAGGFILLAIKIARDRSLAWLVAGCAVAAFTTFYVTQFLDLKGWASDYNVARWEKDRTRKLDLWLLYDYGPAAWPALKHARDLEPDVNVLNSSTSLGRTTTDDTKLAQFNAKHWREFSLRAYWNSRALDTK